MTTELKERDRSIEALVEKVKTRGCERLEYILYKSDIEGRDSFSIQAIQYKSGVKTCQATAGDVSSVFGPALSMFDAVSEGFVEPYVLCDVIYDLLP
ncbi:MAG: hypothetical protein IKN38_03265 [Clostridia bacterium]|nr:hypothetical protein [Clostridia bacterium]